MNLFLSIVAGFLAGTAGAMGLGGGSVLLIYLTVFTETNQFKAQGINLLFFIPIGLIAVIIYAKRKQIEWKKIAWFIIFGTVGTLAASFLLNLIKPDTVKTIFGILISIYGVFEIFKKEKSKNNK